jgi:16S rRNA (uracil1498-N3)-methyltransferase
MRIPRLFIDQTLSTGEIVVLPRDKAHHISHVLRMRSGDPIKLFNDTGYEFDSKIIELTKKSAEVEIGESSKVENESPLNITLCLAIARGQHMDFSIQKAVELGVHTIVPVMSEFSNVKLQESRIQNKLTHWQNIIISAAEQCGRNRLAQLLNPVTFNEWLDSDVSITRLILHPGSQQAMLAIDVVNKSLTLMIGPEGGFSDFEINEAEEKGCIAINLGPRILRAETAVACVLSNAQQLWGDLN